MYTNVTIQQNLSPEQLAESLANSTPKEFAEFWFKFNEQMDKKCNEHKLNDFALAMTPEIGSNRKLIFYRIYRLMQYYEVKAEIE